MSDLMTYELERAADKVMKKKIKFPKNKLKMKDFVGIDDVINNNDVNIEKVKEELKKTESALWKDIQRMKKIIHHLQLKIRFAEQHATYADAFIDKLLKEKRTTVRELKQFKSLFDYKTKEELEDDMDERKTPHYKGWRS
jgi:hypothetical protein